MLTASFAGTEGPRTWAGSRAMSQMGIDLATTLTVVGAPSASDQLKVSKTIRNTVSFRYLVLNRLEVRLSHHTPPDLPDDVFVLEVGVVPNTPPERLPASNR